MNLLFIYGPHAAGKLTVANEIAQLKDYRVFQNHKLVSSVSSVFPDELKKKNKIKKRLTNKFRIEIFKEAAINNVNVIATFGGYGPGKFDFFREIQQAIESSGSKVNFVQLIPDINALMDRVDSPSRIGNKVDNKDYLKKVLTAHPDVFEKFPDVEHLTIDNSNLSPLQTARLIIEHYKL